MPYPAEFLLPQNTQGIGTWDPGDMGELVLAAPCWYVKDWTLWTKVIGLATRGTNINIGKAGTIGVPQVPTESVMGPFDLYVLGDCDPAGDPYDADPIVNAFTGWDQNMALLNAKFAPIVGGDGARVLAVTDYTGWTWGARVQPHGLAREEGPVDGFDRTGRFTLQGHFTFQVTLLAGELIPVASP